MAIPGIHEIQTLATKYSKTQLQKMAQMGLIDTTKAVMAGMMIDRISKQNMAPPATTVAEDALAPPQAPQEAPQEPPQMGPGGAPPQASAGIAALQSNIPEMAGGGIVAFADGGDIPSYKDEGLVSRENFPRISPSLQRAMDRSEVRLPALVGELQTVRAMLPTATGKDKTDLQRIIQGLEKEIRDIKGTAQPVDLPFISSAVAGESAAKKVDSAPPAQAPVKTLEESDREGFMGGLKNLGAAAKDVLSMPGRAIVGLGENILTRPLRAAGVDIPYIDPEFYGETDKNRQGPPSFSLTPYYDQLRKDKTAIDLPPIVAPNKDTTVVPAAPEVFQPRVDVAPSTDQNVPMIRKERGAPEDFTKIDPQQIEVPEATSLKAERERREGAYSEAGVDTNMYKEMMAEVASRKEGGAKKREQALGMALMMTGLGLAGARRGKEFETLSGAGRQALAQFQGTMDNIVANEDKLDNMVRELKMAENNYRKTGAESDLARVRAREDKIEAIGIKNTELKNAAKLESAKLAVTKYGYSKPAPVVEAVYEILKDMPPGTPFLKGLEAYNLSQNISKPQNRLSYEEAAKIVGADVSIMPKDKPAAIEKMLREAERLQGGGGGGGKLVANKDGSYNFVESGK